MSRSILVLGESGTGKSASIRNLDEKTTVIIKPNKKDLPFRGSSLRYSEAKKNIVHVTSFNEIGTYLKQINAVPHIKTVIIEDISHVFSNRVMKDASTAGFLKWSELAKDAFNSLIATEATLRPDLYVIVIAHVDRSTDVQGNQIITMLTPGKLLEQQIKIPSYFTYVLHTDVIEEQGKMSYRFLTNTDGVRVAKSPEGCLNKFEPNDYQLIIDKIEAYQNSVEVVEEVKTVN